MSHRNCQKENLITITFFSYRMKIFRENFFKVLFLLLCLLNFCSNYDEMYLPMTKKIGGCVKWTEFTKKTLKLDLKPPVKRLNAKEIDNEMFRLN